jgi:uncharacterized membrane protein YeaQ/YmgE (transglycosylase-associated protein family)
MSSVIAWIMVGLLSGFFASRMMIGGRSSNPGNLFLQLALGAAGALSAGILFQVSRLNGNDFPDIWSLFVAAVGATLVLGVSRFAFDRQKRPVG